MDVTEVHIKMAIVIRLINLPLREVGIHTIHFFPIGRG